MTSNTHSSRPIHVCPFALETWTERLRSTLDTPGGYGETGGLPTRTTRKRKVRRRVTVRSPKATLSDLSAEGTGRWLVSLPTTSGPGSPEGLPGVRDPSHRHPPVQVTGLQNSRDSVPSDLAPDRPDPPVAGVRPEGRVPSYGLGHTGTSGPVSTRTAHKDGPSTSTTGRRPPSSTLRT